MFYTKKDKQGNYFVFTKDMKKAIIKLGVIEEFEKEYNVKIEDFIKKYKSKVSKKG